MPNKSKASTAKNSLKQQLQLKVIEWNAVKDLFEEQSNSNEGLSILRETLELLRSQKEQLDRSCSELMKLQLTSEELTTLANESAERNITMLKCKQRAKAHRTDASDTESAFNTSAAPSPNLLRKQYPLRNRAMKQMKHQLASRSNQETNNADSSDSEDPDKSQPVFNIEERGRNREFLTGALKTDEGWQNSIRSREENHVRGQNRRESEDRAGHLQQPLSFHINSQAGPTMSHRYTPQNQQPLNSCTGHEVHYNNGSNNNLYNGFPSFPSSPPDWIQHQALMIQNTMSLQVIL